MIRAGGDPAHCTFAGVGKTRGEIIYALEQGIYSFNVESEEELRYLNEVAGELGMTAPAAVRVNPNVDAKTHKYISTGKSENKFGVDFEAIPGLYERAAKELPNIKLRGLQMHIGSQLTSIAPFIEAVEKVAPLAKAAQGTIWHRVLVDRWRHRHHLSGIAGLRFHRLVGKHSPSRIAR